MIERKKLEQVVQNLVMAYRTASETRTVLEKCFGDCDFLTDIIGWTEDALFLLSQDEDADNWNNTLTARLLRSKNLNESEKATLLTDRILKNIEQPAPKTWTSCEFKAMFRENGGYMHDAGRDRGNG